MKYLLILAVLSPLMTQAGDLKENYAGCKSLEALNEMALAEQANDLLWIKSLLDTQKCILTSENIEAEFIRFVGWNSGVAKVKANIPFGAIELFVPIEALDDAKP